jgi:hypothetical protein
MRYGFLLQKFETFFGSGAFNMSREFEVRLERL